MPDHEMSPDGQSRWERRMRLDGRRLCLRLLQPTDEGLLRRFYYRLSPETVYRRFMGPVTPPADALIHGLIDVDHHDREAIIALDERGIAGVARYASLAGQTAPDVAVVVADDWQGRGLGRLLMTQLALVARRRGISRFHGTALGDNGRVRALVRRLSPTARFSFGSGLMDMEIPLRPVSSTRQRFSARKHA